MSLHGMHSLHSKTNKEPLCVACELFVLFFATCVRFVSSSVAFKTVCDKYKNCRASVYCTGIR